MAASGFAFGLISADVCWSTGCGAIEASEKVSYPGIIVAPLRQPDCAESCNCESAEGRDESCVLRAFLKSDKGDKYEWGSCVATEAPKPFE